jgi:hypothetical protein
MEMFIFPTGLRSTAVRQNPRPSGRGSFTIVLFLVYKPSNSTKEVAGGTIICAENGKTRGILPGRL